MNSFKPFSAWRYDLSKVSFDQVVAPPYDIISPERQDELYAKSPYNCIRLILNKPENSDNDEVNRYTRARDFFNGWQAEGVVKQDDTPGFYLYRQTFKDLLTGEEKCRVALLGRLKLEAFEKRAVIPHEKTLDKPKKDRRALMEATNAVFEPIFGLYEKQADLDALYEEVYKQEKLNDIVDDEGVHHELWAVTDEELIAKIQATVEPQKIYIADGHHRYTTALHYAQDIRKQKGTPHDRELSTDYMMMALVNFYDDGLALYPTHRLLNPELKIDKEKTISILKEYFEVEEMETETLRKLLESDEKPEMQFGILFPGDKSYLLTLTNPEKVNALLPQGKSDAWYKLDVNVLGYLIFQKAFGLGESDWEANLAFTHDYKEAREALPQNKASVVFLLKAPRIKILQDMCDAQELMPQKSTYFYPKMGSGFMFYQHTKGE